MNVQLGNPVSPLPSTVLIEPKYCHCCGNLFFRPVVLEMSNDGRLINASTCFCPSCKLSPFGRPDSEAVEEFKHNTHLPIGDRRKKRKFRKLKKASHVSFECKELDIHELNCPDLNCGCSCHRGEFDA